MDNEKIIEKIRKLLARGDEARNDNAFEREIAMRQAHAMLARHGLDMIDIGDTDPSAQLGPQGRVEIKLGRAHWHAQVWHDIARLHGCSGIRDSHKIGGQRYWIIGRKLHVTIARSMATWIVESIQKEITAQRPRDRTAFGNGAASGIYQSIKKILDAMARGQLGDEIVSAGTALVLVNQHAQAIVEAEKARASWWPELQAGRYRASGDIGSYRAGQQYGSSIGLSTQISGAGQKRISA